MTLKQDKRNVPLAIMAGLAVLVMISPFAAAATPVDDEMPAKPTLEELDAMTDPELWVPTQIQTIEERVVEAQAAVVSTLEDQGLLFIIPAIEELAREHGLDIIFSEVPVSQASFVGLSADGVEVDRVNVVATAAVFEDVPVTDSLLYSFTFYDDQGVAVEEFIDVQTLVAKAIAGDGSVIDSLSDYVVLNGASATYGVPSIFNLQPQEPGDEVQNLIDKVPKGYSVPANHNYGTAQPKYNARTNNDYSSCRNGYNQMYRQIAPPRYDARDSPSTARGVFAYGEWRVEFPYKHSCDNSYGNRGQFGFGWSWSGKTSFPYYGVQEAFTWNTASEGSKSISGRGSTTYGHEIAVSGSKAFFYNPSGVYTSYYSNGEMGRSSQSCGTEWNFWVAKKAAELLLSRGRSLGILSEAIPTKYCDEYWNSISSSWYGSGKGVDSNFWANGKGYGKQINPHGELKLYFHDCAPRFDLKVEGASEHTAKTRANTASPWVSERSWLVMRSSVPARLC